EWYDRTQKPKVAARRKEAEKERERIRKRVKKRCARCRRVMLRSAFSQHNGNPDGLQTYCRRCMGDYQQCYYDGNPDKHQQRKRRQADWQRNLSPEKKKAAKLRALLARHQLAEGELAALDAACGHRCQVCKLHASEHRWKALSNQLCIDHALVA